METELIEDIDSMQVENLKDLMEIRDNIKPPNVVSKSNQITISLFLTILVVTLFNPTT